MNLLNNNQAPDMIADLIDSPEGLNRFAIGFEAVESRGRLAEAPASALDELRLRLDGLPQDQDQDPAVVLGMLVGITFQREAEEIAEIAELDSLLPRWGGSA